MFAALSEEDKGALRATSFAPLLLIDPIVTMSMLVVEIFDRHLGDMKMRRFPKKKNTYGLKEIDNALKQEKLERYQAMNPSETDMQQDLVQESHQIEAPAISAVPAISIPTVGAPTIGSSSSTTEIKAVVVRVCSQLEEHGDSTLPLGDTLLLGQHQFFTPEKSVKPKREGGNEKEDDKRKMAKPRTRKDDDVEVGREVNFNAISSKFGGDLLEKKGDKKDNADKKDVEEKVKSEEEEVQEIEESKNGNEKLDGDEKVDDVAEEEDSK
ncbi:hypothetical protein GIB67_014735 [Kingdonia uniflora]|uniref:Uncharacterized protein n=1 Tax=Kingdonia uniflora TaxID=39325 RepID=A0A7J7NVH9_9MAGN|nr:hypothetical protein GIB67_014735 [Kingdonia uniflora]